MTEKWLFLQNFRWNDAGGAPRVLRTMVRGREDRVVAVYSGSTPPEESATPTEEIWLPQRRSWGRIERSRFHRIPELFCFIGLSGYTRRLIAFARTSGITGIHAIAHGNDFIHAHRLSKALGVPFYMSVHDDIRAVPLGGLRERWMKDAWQDAARILAISPELAEEYGARYGHRSYEVITDGAEILTEVPGIQPEARDLYMFGSFHLSYEDNLRIVARVMADDGAKVRARVGALRPEFAKEVVDNVTVLPYVSLSELRSTTITDLVPTAALYLPLPFGKDYHWFTRFSLSTKLISYLGMGRPIIYHGPAEAAAAQLLAKHDAAVLVCSNDPLELRAALERCRREGTQLVENALSLAREQFDDAVIRRRFWGS